MRARSTLAATLVVALALAVAGATLVVLLQRSLVAGIDSAATTRAHELAALVPPGGLDRAGDDVVEALTAAVTAVSTQASMVQVLAPDGTVVAASDDIDGEGPLSPARPRPGDLVREDRQIPVEEEDRFRLVVAAVGTDEGVYTVIVGQSLGPVEDSIQAVAALVAVGYPILLVVVGSATFWFVGRSLRPVEAIRAKVAGIGGRELTERVPVPAARDEVARLAVTMNEMLDRLEAAQRSQRQFVADASHELRSPVATLRATAEIALAHPGQADTDPAVVAAGTLAETRRLERLINDLLLLARADERGLLPDRREVDLDDLLAAEATRVRATTGLQVTAQIAAVRVLGDRHQLAQAVRNLVDNATRHATTQVDLALGRHGSDAVIEISDDGPGIPRADRERVFDRFVRLDESRERARGGSGLGLAIVREIVTAHGGTVTVTDSAIGARLRLSIPAQPADV
nr:ATP-binding protein [Cellulomonas fimi]